MSEEQHRLALPQGTRIRDFEFHRVLGHGGFGITYLGWNVTLDIPVAIKEYLPADLATREQDLSVVPQTSQAAADFQWGLDRFLDEARTLARFQHPSIVRVHHFFAAHSTAYIVMDYVEGEDLSAYLTRKGTLTEAELKGILYPLLDGLAVVHGADFLHRDIKPGNIVRRDADGSPVLLDFGAARQAIGAKSRSVTSIVTPGYAPIEQYSSRGRQGAWTDIYALGGVCYRALTGDVPADATDRVRRDPLVAVSQRCAGRASAGFLSAIDRALSVDEEDRPPSVAAWRTALEAEGVAGERRETGGASDVQRKESRPRPSEPVVREETDDAERSDYKKRPTLQDIERQIKELGLTNVSKIKEIRYLPEILSQDETLRGITFGYVKTNFDYGNWFIAITNKRIIFLNKGMIFSLNQKVIPLKKINSIEHKTGVTYGEIKLWYGTSHVRITDIDNNMKSFIVAMKDAIQARSKEVSLMEQEAPTPQAKPAPRTQAKSKEVSLMQPQEKDNQIAVLLSLFITGAGQIYTGATTRGVIQVFIYFKLWLLTATTVGGMFIFLIPYWIWGMFDANKQAKKYNLAMARKQDDAEKEARKTISASEFIAQLEKIAKLHGVNLLNQEEYDSKKRDLILSLVDRKPKEDGEDFLAALIPSIERKYLSESEIAQIKNLVM